MKGDLRNSPESNFTRSAHELNLKHTFEDYMFKITSTSPRVPGLEGSYNLFTSTLSCAVYQSAMI